MNTGTNSEILFVKELASLLNNNPLKIIAKSNSFKRKVPK